MPAEKRTYPPGVSRDIPAREVKSKEMQHSENVERQLDALEERFNDLVKIVDRLVTVVETMRAGK